MIEVFVGGEVLETAFTDSSPFNKKACLPRGLNYHNHKNAIRPMGRLILSLALTNLGKRCLTRLPTALSLESPY
jgi:hypothetical protein